MFWQTSRRQLNLEHSLVMAILNVTADSFSDGGRFLSIDNALRQAEKLIENGADIIDIGGESTRPGGTRVPDEEEIERVVPIIKETAKRYDIPISIDTSKAKIARAAADAGAEIINDISGLRFDEALGQVAAEYRTGIVLMHSRGDFESMHSQQPVANILAEVSSGIRSSISVARACGVTDESIALDVGIGFGKTTEQNLELLAKLDKLIIEFPQYPMLIGASRKSFIGKVLGGAPTGERLSGSLAAAAIAVWNGVNIVRVHDVKETVDAIKIVSAIEREKGL